MDGNELGVAAITINFADEDSYKKFYEEVATSAGSEKTRVPQTIRGYVMFYN
jgi:hypothetical protein